MNTLGFRPAWLLLIATAGCATVTTGTDQPIAFAFSQPGTQCEVKRGSEALGVVSAAQPSLKVQKHFLPLDLNCKRGTASLQGQVRASLSKEGMLGGAITMSSVAVDAMSGALYIYPDKVTVDMAAKKVSYAEPFQLAQQPGGPPPATEATYPPESTN